MSRPAGSLPSGVIISPENRIFFPSGRKRRRRLVLRACWSAASRSAALAIDQEQVRVAVDQRRADEKVVVHRRELGAPDLVERNLDSFQLPAGQVVEEKEIPLFLLSAKRDPASVGRNADAVTVRVDVFELRPVDSEERMFRSRGDVVLENARYAVAIRDVVQRLPVRAKGQARR